MGMSEDELFSNTGALISQDGTARILSFSNEGYCV